MAVTASTPATLDPRAVARVDCDAISHNCTVLKRQLGDAAGLCAVVKADGYGHGAAQSARAALAGGASWIAVVSPREALSLREQGIDARLLVMGALTAETVADALAADADFVVWRDDQLVAARSAARAAGCTGRVHVKLDTGMGRLGTRDPELALELLRAAAAADELEPAGFMTHFATADERREPEYFDVQLGLFTRAAERVRNEFADVVIHAANSAAVFRSTQSHFDLARCGIAIYGLDPFQGDPATLELRPALSLETYVADVKKLGPGESVGYGRKWRAEQPTAVAVLPIGYGDGFRRLLTNKGTALIGGARHPVVGTVSMDNITVELGLDSGVRAGDSAMLIGTQGNEQILTEELAREAATINYEITCGLSTRVPRVYRGATARP